MKNPWNVGGIEYSYAKPVIHFPMPTRIGAWTKLVFYILIM